MLFNLMAGGHTYNAASVVLRTQTHFLWLLPFCCLTFIGAYMQYFGAIAMGFRHRTHSIPLVANLWFFAHDTIYVMNFHHWFHDIDFWLAKAFWFGLAIYVCCEIVMTYQILKFSRQELFPGMSLAQASASYGALQAFAFAMFCWFLSMINDPLFYLCFSTTVILAPMMNISMMRARGSRKGFSSPMLIGFVLLAIGFWGWMFISDAYFLRPLFFVIAAGNLGFALAGLAVFKRLPIYTPPRAATAIATPAYHTLGAM